MEDGREEVLFFIPWFGGVSTWSWTCRSPVKVFLRPDGHRRVGSSGDAEQVLPGPSAGQVAVAGITSGTRPLELVEAYSPE